MLEYRVTALRLDQNGSQANAKDALLTLDTAVTGRRDAFNPAELLLASLAACMLKGVERFIPILHFQLRSAEIALHGIRQDAPPRMLAIDYEIVIDTDEDDHRLELFHTNIRKYGTISNTLANALELKGIIKRK